MAEYLEGRAHVEAVVAVKYFSRNPDDEIRHGETIAFTSSSKYSEDIELTQQSHPFSTEIKSEDETNLTSIAASSSDSITEINKTFNVADETPIASTVSPSDNVKLMLCVIIVGVCFIIIILYLNVLANSTGK